MTTQTKMTSITLLILSMCFANIALADNCYDQSPQLVALADTYYDLEKTHVLTDDEQAHLAVFLDKLKGQWQGDAVSTTCAGSENNPRAKRNSATITAEATMLPNGNLRVRASKFDTRGKINRGERLDLLDIGHVFSFAFTDENQLTFSERFRRQNNNQSSRLTEVLYDIKVISDGLTLKRTYYTNGVLTGSETWMLDAD
jgi:hypothetical protein